MIMHIIRNSTYHAKGVSRIYVSQSGMRTADSDQSAVRTETSQPIRCKNRLHQSLMLSIHSEYDQAWVIGRGPSPRRQHQQQSHCATWAGKPCIRNIELFIMRMFNGWWEVLHRPWTLPTQGSHEKHGQAILMSRYAKVRLHEDI